MDPTRQKIAVDQMTYQRKQVKQPSDLRQEVDIMTFLDETLAGDRKDSSSSKVETTEFGTVATPSPQKSGTVNIDEDEITTPKKQLAESRTKAEAQHEEDLKRVRSKMMQVRQTARQVELKAQDAAREANRDTLTHSWGSSDPLRSSSEKSKSLSPSCSWRNTKRQRGTLKVDYSRIETEFIFSSEFVDDVNTMLDFIAGWPADLVEDINRAFKEDPDNRSRRIEFVDMGGFEWAVRILNPDRPDFCQGPADIYALKDLPDDCREHGCVRGCSRNTIMRNRWVNSKEVRGPQKGKQPLDVMAAACKLAGSSLGVLPDASDPRRPIRPGKPPPLPPRSENRNVTPMPPPSKPRSHKHTQQPLERSWLKSMDSLEEDTSDAYVEQLKRKNAGLENQISELKAWTEQTKIQHIGSNDGQVALGKRTKEIYIGIEPDNSQFSVGNARKDSAQDTQVFGPIGGKLVHDEKVPGPYNTSTEAMKADKAFDRRSKIPQLTDESIRDRPRKEFYARRVPTASSSEKDTQEAVTTPSSTTSKAPRIKFIPRYQTNPEEY
ncbi:hypothetical protein N0V94_007175 [Neodidymelliopsis sp. IMI 364377]|nr:hypothetical protein N0V94_007175 [Neodidymelliopsis sp. IMI 364377]